MDNGHEIPLAPGQRMPRTISHLLAPGKTQLQDSLGLGQIPHWTFGSAAGYVERFCFNAKGKGKDTDSKDSVSKKFLPCLLAAMPPTTVIAVSSAVFKVDGDVIS